MYTPTGYKERLHAVAAKALEMSVAELEAAFAEGYTIQHLAEAAGVDLSEVRSAMDQVHRERIQQAVDEGALSQEQADLLLKRVSLSSWLVASDNRPISSVAEAALGPSRLSIAHRI